MSAVILLLLLVIAVSSLSLFSTEKTAAVMGIVTLNQTLKSKTQLDGEWEFYPNVFFTEFPQENVFTHPQYVSLPMGKITDAGMCGTYRLTLSADTSGEWVILIPNLKHPIELFVNGIKQPPAQNAQNKKLLYPLRCIFPINAFNADLPLQEIVISINATEKNAPLFKRPILLTTYADALAYSYLKTVNSFLFLGMIMIVMFNGFIFMILMPQHRIISLITLFDTAIVLRILFGSDDITALLSLLLGIPFSSTFLLSAQLCSFMLGGFFGSQLAQGLLDEDHQVPRSLTTPIPVIYLILLIVLPLNLPFFYRFGQPLVIVVYVYTFITVFYQFYVYWRKYKTIYSAFQIIKTSYIGAVLFVDIVFLATYKNFLMFEYLYLFFFLAHILTKLYDNNDSYREVFLLNQNLEKTVQERTLELSLKNKSLSELSIRDPLTGAYNRLYFDQMIEKSLGSPHAKDNNIHLCMFDLDYFKSINDTYGHDAGDEQLKTVAETVLSIIPENALFARVGGEEFMILYTGIQSADVLKNIESIQKAFEQQKNGDPRRTTASFGLIKYTALCSKKDFLKMADKNLYYAKDGGRNKIVYDFSASGE